ncbi:MAG: hypothetical protein ACRD0M_12240, partial [Acidimicrobiales bacterium]
IPAGTHFVCYRAMDVAGNTAGQACTASIRVDLAPPDVAIVPSPAVPDGANGWYVSEPTVRILGTDPVPGSGISLATAPSGVFASVDGLAYTAVTGPRTIPEGRHIVRAFSVDVSGQRSPVREMTFKVDLSHPVTTARALPPDPAAGQWWRRVPRVVLRATDGQANAGVGAIEYRIDGGPPQTYTGPFAVPSGAHTVTYRALDLSGPANTEPDRVVGVPVDVTPPLVKATEASPAIWLRLLGLFGPAQARLNWQLSDDLSGTVRVRVVVHNVAGQVVRRIDDGTRTVTPATTLSGFTLWDGRDDSLLGIVPAGVYYYRVTVIDEAGNTAHSGESKPLQIKVL